MANNFATKLHIDNRSLIHYEGPSSVNPKSAWTLTPKWGTSLSQNLTPHRKIWDPLNITGTMRDRKLKFYIHLDRIKYSFQIWTFSARGRAGGAAPRSINLGPPHISEATRARKLKFYTHLDSLYYTLFGRTFFC